MKIGILGGTFDPPHMGHILLAQNAKEKCELDKIVLLPSANPPHKNADSPGEHRLNMTRLVARAYSFDMCDIEYKKESPSYTFETIDELKDIFSGDKLFFIIGSDSMLDFEKWYRWRELLKKCAFIVGVRNEKERIAVEECAAEKRENYGAEIYVLDSPAHKVSSSDIRMGENVGEIPPCVRNYIKEHSLYEGVII